MNGEPPVPSFTDAEVLDCLRRAAERGLDATKQAQEDLEDARYDMEGVNELIAECAVDELHKHELSQNYPAFNDYIVVLKVDLADEKRPFYVKVALHLPSLDSGELMSFHVWGLKR